MGMATRICLGVLLCLAAGAEAAGPAWQPVGKKFEWRQGARLVRFDQGRLTAGLGDRAQMQCTIFFHHDKWIYETLAGGPIEKGPTIAPNGDLVQQGSFSARDCPPLKYELTLRPDAEGVDVDCRFEKSGPVEMKTGLMLHVSMAQAQVPPSNWAWIEPSSFGRVGTALRGSGQRLWVELADGMAARIETPEFREVVSERTTQSCLFRYNLVPKDVERGEARFRISFAQLPETFPGEIKPQQLAPRLGSPKPLAEKVGRYEKFEAAIDLDATYTNPYDPDQVRLDAEFIAPSGKRSVVPGFFMVDYDRSVRAGAEVLAARGHGVWKVRFAPREVGTYRWNCTLVNQKQALKSPEYRFEAVASDRPGYVGVSRADPHYFAFDNGQGYFAVGHNLPLFHATGQLSDEAMRKFAAGGENFNRWWLSSGGFGLEWMEQLGWYRQESAARLDAMLDLARELGLYYMLCLDTHQDFRERGWDGNPFNARNGGPCETPADWFTNETAKTYYKKRLRYTVARWGYSPHVLCWEFGNEMEGWDKSPDTIKLPWHREMSDYLRSIDPFGHLITTSFWSKTGPEEYWRLPNIDIVQTHCYTNDDANVGPAVRGYCLHQWEKFAKPHVFGEFGIRSHDSTADKDPKGWAIHNSLWAGLVSLAAGGPMPWWHENYIEPLDLYFHFDSVARFAKTLPLGTAAWRPLTISPPEYADTKRPPTVRDAVVSTVSTWGKDPNSRFVVQRDGTVAGDARPHQLLHAGGHRDLRNPPTFVVEYPTPGTFGVQIGKVSSGGLLKIWVDGKLALSRDLPCGDKLGKDSQYKERWKLWETTYDETISVDVPAGKHEIRVDNEGRDWVTVTRYILPRCALIDRPQVLATGMASDRVAVVWIQNLDSCWYNHQVEGKVGSVDPFRLGLELGGEGVCKIQWWSTWKSAILKTTTGTLKQGVLTLELPSLRTDVALRIERN